MVGDLFINGKDAYQVWGVTMGDKFLDALGEKAGKKDYITNNDRTKNGVEYCDSVPKTNERTVTLTFTITGSSQSDFVAKRDAFYEELDKGNIDIIIPKDSAKVYHLKFKDSTGGYAQNTERTFCKLGVKFIEPNPTNRT